MSVLADAGNCVTCRRVNIYGKPIYIYHDPSNESNEDAPWCAVQPLQQGQCTFPPPNPPASSFTMVAEIHRSLSFVTHSEADPSSCSPLQVASGFINRNPFSMTVVHLGYLADHVCYSILKNGLTQSFLESNPTPAGSRYTTAQYWQKMLKRTDFFHSKILRTKWIPNLKHSKGSNLWELFGFELRTDEQQCHRRQQWVRVFERMRHRFIHRGSYLLDNDVREMREVVVEANQCSLPINSNDEFVLHEFALYISRKLLELATP